MKILAIETSCDETAVSLLEIEEVNELLEVSVLGNNLLSQIKIHSPMGGVVPMLAKREHSKNLIPILKKTLEDEGGYKEKTTEKLSEKTYKEVEGIFKHEPELYKEFQEFIPSIETPNIDVIAVTTGPGLEPALWVGINFARALGLVWQKPIIGINHMEGHVLSSLLLEKNDKKLIFKNPEFPILSLLISGGHTELVLSKKFESYEIIGETQDDAVGEAFDKVARMLGLPYPGGPEISRLAEEARSEDLLSEIKLPRPMINTPDLNFSFSGLKTAVLYTLKKEGVEPFDISKDFKKKIAREFEDSITEVLVSKVGKALVQTNAKTLAIGGGVIANKNIRKGMESLIKNEFPETKLFLPVQKLTTDNALMIGLTGYFKFKESGSDEDEKLVANGNLRLS